MRLSTSPNLDRLAHELKGLMIVEVVYLSSKKQTLPFLLLTNQKNYLTGVSCAGGFFSKG